MRLPTSAPRTRPHVRITRPQKFSHQLHMFPTLSGIPESLRKPSPHTSHPTLDHTQVSAATHRLPSRATSLAPERSPYRRHRLHVQTFTQAFSSCSNSDRPRHLHVQRTYRMRLVSGTLRTRRDGIILRDDIIFRSTLSASYNWAGGSVLALLAQFLELKLDLVLHSN